MTDFDLIATTAFGLEALVARELQTLGYQTHITQPGWVAFQGDAAAVCRANLWLRTADRVLVRVASFEATDFGRLFDNTKAADWAAWIPRDGKLHVNGRSIKSQLSSVPACQRMVNKAIVDSLLAGHQLQSLPESGQRYRIEVAILKDQVTLTLDTTGPSLHKRGYRTLVGTAPLKETLAAALVQLSFWSPGRPLLDPFCGSGTIPIEAALIGRNIAPGLGREFAAEHWPALAPSLWQEERQRARDLIRPDLEERVLGTDQDPEALKLARFHAEQAGVADSIHFQEKLFEQLSSKREFGCLITNPPYGERLSERSALEPLYRSIPQVLRRLPTWSHFILTAYPDFERLIQKQANRRRKLYNGRIECTYYQFHGPEPGRPAPSEENATELPTPVFGGVNAKASEQADLFRSRLLKRARHLRRWPTRQGITCYRLYERDIPEIPFVVDRYEDHLHMVEFDRPHDRDLAQHADWVELMAATAADALEVERDHVFVKHKHFQKGNSQHTPQAELRYERVVNEGGLKFIVNLSDYVDTGLFLDHRQTRDMVRRAAQDKHVLNLFAYSGAFSVYAAAGGAASVTTVDWSNTYLEWSRRNMALNNFTGPQYEFLRADAREFLTGEAGERRYDLAIVDPPTFSNSKRAEEDWVVQRDHPEMLNQVLARMQPGGVMFFSTNFRRFKLADTGIAATEIREISRQTVPPDFRNERIHRCWRIVK